MRSERQAVVRVHRPTSSLWLNTNRANPDQDGAVWQGRGVTTAITGGLTIDDRHVSIAIRPIAFWTQNLDYTPFTRRPITAGDFGSPIFGYGVDEPYRFGGHSFARMDPGESWIKFQAGQFEGGMSTASQHWGPMNRYPLVMGTEAGGYPRFFIRGAVLPTWIGGLTAEWNVGRLESSNYTDLAKGNRSRISPAVVLSFQPHVFPGLELGAARMFHVRWTKNSVDLATATLPFKGLLKKGNPTGENSTSDFNQLASVFARIQPRQGAVAIYGEFYREDHNVNTRDVVSEPDHASGYGLGIQRAWRVGTDATLVTIEFLNSRSTHLARVRTQAPLHTHFLITEGHTFRGQPLGSEAVIGGGGLWAQWETVHQRSSTVLQGELRRTAQDAEGGTLQGALTGVYMIRAGRRILKASANYGAYLGVQRGFGLDHSTSVSVSFSSQRLR